MTLHGFILRNALRNKRRLILTVLSVALSLFLFTTLQTALDIEKAVRGTTAGFHTPTFVVDAPGGGGKRVAHSFEHYDRQTGVSVFSAPSVKPGFFLYFDPVDTLEPEIQNRWKDPAEQQKMVDAAIAQAQANQAASARASSVR